MIKTREGYDAAEERQKTGWYTPIEKIWEKAVCPAGEKTEKLQKELYFHLPDTNRPKGKKFKKAYKKHLSSPARVEKPAAKKGDFVLKELQGLKNIYFVNSRLDYSNTMAKKLAGASDAD